MSWLSRFQESDFPTSNVPGLSNSEVYSQQVKKLLQRSVSMVSALDVDAPLYFFVVHGGSSVGTGIMGGMWIFDPLTSLWSIPSGFSDIDDRGTGRWMHSMITTGGTVILNGGGGDNGAAPASLTTIQLIPNVLPLYSFPFSAWPIQYTTNLVGNPRNCIIGIVWRFLLLLQIRLYFKCICILGESRASSRKYSSKSHKFFNQSISIHGPNQLGFQDHLVVIH